MEDIMVMNQFNSIAETMSAIANQNSQIANSISIITKKISMTDDNVSTLTQRMDKLEYDEEITQETQKSMKKAADRRVHDLLPDAVDYKVYCPYFYSRLWEDARANAGVGSAIGKTQKKDAPRAMSYIATWMPDEGMEAFLCYCDRRISAREFAKDRERDIIAAEKRRKEEIMAVAAAHIAAIKATVDPNDDDGYSDDE